MGASSDVNSGVQLAEQHLALWSLRSRYHPCRQMQRRDETVNHRQRRSWCWTQWNRVRVTACLMRALSNAVGDVSDGALVVMKTKIDKRS